MLLFEIALKPRRLQVVRNAELTNRACKRVIELLARWAAPKQIGIKRYAARYEFFDDAWDRSQTLECTFDDVAASA